MGLCAFLAFKLGSYKLGTDFVRLLVVTVKKVLVLHPKSRPSLPIDPACVDSPSGVLQLFSLLLEPTESAFIDHC